MATSQSQPAQPAVTWTVGVQMASVGADATGKMVNGYDIPFTLSTGHVDSVFVPNAVYNIDTVKAAIQAKADQIIAVSRLTGTAGGA